MTSDLLPKKQRALCEDCRTDAYGPPEAYTYDAWPASTCRRSRKWHRRVAIARQPGTTTYRSGEVLRDVPLPEDEE
jgi:hypothetical protein